MASLLLFAAAREAAGCSRSTVQGTRLHDVLRDARSRYGDRFAEVLRYSTVLVDGEQIRGDVDLREDAEVAILPPVSGG